MSRLNQNKNIEITNDDVVELLKGSPNFMEGDKEAIYFDESKQLAFVQNVETEDVVSIVRRKKSRRNGTMFNEVMEKIGEFLDNTPDDIFEFSLRLEDALVEDYETMEKEQPQAAYLLSQRIPDICASAEPGMKMADIMEFKKMLREEYDKALTLIK